MSFVGNTPSCQSSGGVSRLVQLGRAWGRGDLGRNLYDWDGLGFKRTLTENWSPFIANMSLKDVGWCRVYGVRTERESARIEPSSFEGGEPLYVKGVYSRTQGGPEAAWSCRVRVPARDWNPEKRVGEKGAETRRMPDSGREGGVKRPIRAECHSLKGKATQTGRGPRCRRTFSWG